MKRLSFLLAVISLVVPMLAYGQVVEVEGSFLEPLQQRDSVLIGDQFRYGFHLKGVPEGTGLGLADLSKGLMDSIVVVQPWAADTVKVYGGRKQAKSYDIDVYVVITSFDEGLYELPRLPVLKADAEGRVDSLLFDSQTLDVRTMPVDTSSYKVHDIKGQIRYPVTFREILPYIIAAWTFAFLCILVWALLSSRRKKESLASGRKDPPYVVALRKLEEYRGSKYWAPEKQKILYSGITDTLREYIDARFGIDAPEMTTAEIFSVLKDKDIPEDLYVRTKELFETADLVKFAKAFASDEENAAALPAAVRFVTATFQSQLDLEQEDAKEGGES
ncbi:MAG: hypothetical protein J6Z47_08675 [Bacteroidales bacterium]|nr:hypothetical protein [Bacteroidales bacterium]